MNELCKIVRVVGLSLATLLALASCATGNYAVMRTSEGSKNPEGDLYNPKVPWYETQEPVKRPAWTQSPTGKQPGKDTDKNKAFFIVSCGEDKSPRSYFMAMKTIEDKARTDVREYIRGIEEQKAKKEGADSASQLENRVQKLSEAVIRETTRGTLYWELHRFPDSLKAKNAQAEWYFLVWAEYSVPVETLERGTVTSDKTDFDKKQLENLNGRMMELDAYFSRVDHLISPHSDFINYIKQYNKLLDIGFTLETLTTLIADPEYKALREKTNAMTTANDPTETLRMYTEEQIAFIQNNLPKLVEIPPEPEQKKIETPPTVTKEPVIPAPTPEEELAALKKNFEGLMVYFKDVDDKKINPLAVDHFRAYMTKYYDLIEIEASLMSLKMPESNDVWKDANATTTAMVVKYNPFKVATNDLTDEYARMLSSETKLSEYMDTIWNWKLPTRAERAKAEVYTTKKGDTLVKIARKKLGSGLYWYWLWRCNYNPKKAIFINPDELPPGTKLIIVPMREPLNPSYSASQEKPRE